MAISTVSFNKTPQAGDDLYAATVTGFTEDTLNSYIMNVMSNDLGGAAKWLWSIDDGTDSSGAKTASDLLQQDQVGCTNLSANGAQISITTDGKIKYQQTAASNAHFQTLTAGQTGLDSFIYAIRLASGTLSWANVLVEVGGVNDAGTITSIDKSGGVIEDTKLTASGAITVSDVDNGEAHALNGAGNTANGSYAVTAGAWNYQVNNAAIQHLGKGATTTDTFTAYSADKSASQAVTVTITGVNDIASISGASTGSADENGATPATGTLTVTDADDGESHANPASGAGDNVLGSYTIDAGGHWSYTASEAANNHLAAGDTATDSFTITSADGSTSQTVTILINGSNDTATIGGTLSGTTDEDNTSPVIGTANETDADDNQ
jgi:VCBS repeat-containing protein